MPRCEVCEEQVKRRIFVARRWHDGTVDLLLVCKKHAQSDPQGAWKMTRITGKGGENS